MTEADLCFLSCSFLQKLSFTFDLNRQSFNISIKRSVKIVNFAAIEKSFSRHLNVARIDFGIEQNEKAIFL